jgi:hypothetical protein
MACFGSLVKEKYVQTQIPQALHRKILAYEKSL